MYERTGHVLRKDVDPVVASRVDMLLAIYDGALEAIDGVVLAITEERTHEASVSRSRALVLVSLIENGLDLSKGEIPQRIKELCGFVVQALLDLEVDKIRSARNVLQNLRDGFAGIQEEANQLEATGRIPHLIQSNALDTIA